MRRWIQSSTARAKLTAMSPALQSRNQSTQIQNKIFNPTPEHAQFRQLMRNFTETRIEPQALAHNRDEKSNWKIFHELADLGVLGLTVAPEYGGCGMDAVACVIMAEEVSASDPSVAMTFGPHSNLFANNLNQNGNEMQKRKYLPDACLGKRIGGMCMSEPEAGTDVLGMRTTAILSDDKSHFILNGTKMWISNGTIDGTDTGDMYLVYAKTSSGRGMQDITTFIVEKGMEGFRLGQKITDKCGMRASHTAELVFDNVKVPVENVVGKVGGGALCMMRNLQIERVALAAMSLGIARRCIEVMSQYAQDRKAFGRSIGEFGQIQQMIAESYSEFVGARHYVYNFAAEMELSDFGAGLDSDATKLFAAPIAKTIADRAMQVLGGNGYTGQYVVERLWRDSKLIEIGGGTNEAHHKNMMRDLNRFNGKLF